MYCFEQLKCRHLWCDAWSGKDV